MREEKSKRASPSRNRSDSTHLPGEEIEEGHLAEREQGNKRLALGEVIGSLRDRPYDGELW